MHGRHLRVEHWDVAFNHGKTAALNMLGQRTEHDVVPYFWTDLADVEIESVGPAHSWEEIVIRGDVTSDKYSAWYLDGGKLAGVAAVHSADDLDVGRSLIAAGGALPDGAAAVIADPSSDLAALQ